MDQTQPEDLEIYLLLEALARRYGYDFRHYSSASLKRRIRHFLSLSPDCNHISDLIPRLIYDKTFFKSFILTLSITVTEMFRDPFVYKMIREKVVPLLKTYPFIRVWHAGCASGEEVYSLAILLEEEGLYSRCQIYATDLNDDALSKAKQGIYSVDRIKEFTLNYQQSGGSKSLAKYYHSKYDSVILDSSLKKNIVFANHNLVSDSVFGEMHLILCRNVMIYFNRTLQDRVLQLFHDSLVPKGFLCIGTKESLQFSQVVNLFKTIADRERIYQRY